MLTEPAKEASPGLILGIESSCDDTAASVLSPEGRVLSSCVASQTEVHAPYGGVVPELASRQHMQNLPRVVRHAMREAGACWADLSSVAVTAGPGLLGSLLVGLSYAKTFAWGLKLPLYAVNHVEAHLRSPWLEHPELPYPCLTLAVSGGHSHLFLAGSPTRARLVASTRDDAAGEALDKLAKRLFLPYPGGPVMDRLASRGNPKAIAFSLPRMSAGSLDYSFSGIKTAALHYLRTSGLEPVRADGTDALPQWEYDLIASYQRRVVDHLLQRLKAAALALRPAAIAMTGGVACNTLLRERFAKLGSDLDLPAAFPSPRFCTDNAAMVAFQGLTLMRAGRPAESEADAFATATWERVPLPTHRST